MDLGGTLKCQALKGHRRRLTGSKRDGAIAVRDTFELENAVTIQDRVVSMTEPIRLNDSAIRIGGAQGMTLRYDARQLDCAINTVAHRTAVGEWVYTIDLIPRESKRGRIVIEMLWTAE